MVYTKIKAVYTLYFRVVYTAFLFGVSVMSVRSPAVSFRFTPQDISNLNAIAIYYQNRDKFAIGHFQVSRTEILRRLMELELIRIEEETRKIEAKLKGDQVEYMATTVDVVQLGGKETAKDRKTRLQRERRARQRKSK